MSTDRFLTRVFDKQEKKMLYEGDTFHHMAYPKNKLLFKTAHKNGLLCHVAGNSFDDPWNDIIATIEFGDRFAPMMCLGRQDKNKKLIYSADIVATSNNKYLVYREEKSAAFWFKRLDNECELLIDDFSCEIEIIGNKWEHPELKEKKV